MGAGSVRLARPAPPRSAGRRPGRAPLRGSAFRAAPMGTGGCASRDLWSDRGRATEPWVRRRERGAWVTGAGRGIGRAVARRLARHGALVALPYGAREDAAQDAVGEITTSGGRAFAVGSRLSAQGDAEALYEVFRAETGMNARRRETPEAAAALAALRVRPHGPTGRHRRRRGLPRLQGRAPGHRPEHRRHGRHRDPSGRSVRRRADQTARRGTPSARHSSRAPRTSLTRP